MSSPDVGVRQRKKIPSGLWAFLLLATLLGFGTVHSIYSDMGLNNRDSSNKNNNNKNKNKHELSRQSRKRKLLSLQDLTQGQGSNRKLDSNNAANVRVKSSCNHPSMTWIENKEAITNDGAVGNQKQQKCRQRIPCIIHQSASSRCAPSSLISSLSHWRNLSMYSYYFHDDDAVWRLIRQDWPEFPLLHKALKCVKSMTAVVDLWRLLVLWEYGGIYVDLDTIPNLESNLTWTPDHIHPDDDAYMVVEFYDAPSQYFMAMTPRHPILFYSIHLALANVLAADSVIRLDPSLTTGPFATLDGFSMFMLDVGKVVSKPVTGGGHVYYGTFNKSVRIDGHGRARSNEILSRESMKRAVKKELYRAMNMTHFWDVVDEGRASKLRSRSCFGVWYDLNVGPPEWYIPNLETEDRTDYWKDALPLQ